MKTHNLYIVGGYIRDKLLGLQSKDIDYSFEFTPEYVQESKFESTLEAYDSMNAILKSQGFRIYKEHPDCFTTKAKFPPEHQFAGQDADIVMCRKETYPDPDSRTPHVELGTLWDDLQRRDFTVNAIAQDLEGNLIDPFGGQNDIRDKILRCPIDAQTSFSDDPLRTIRGLRFTLTKGFELNLDAIEALQKDEIWSKFDRVVSRERVRDELYKMMKFDSLETFLVLQKYLSKDCIKNHILKDDIWFEPTNKQR